MQITKNFHLDEFKCKDGTPVPQEYVPNVIELAGRLQKIRDYITDKTGEETPLKVISGYRSPAHNKKVGGAKKSQHLTASAADIKCRMKPATFKYYLEEMIREGLLEDGGVGLYKTFVHLDIGRPRRW